MLTEYYYDELLEVFAEYGVLHAIDNEDESGEQDYSEKMEDFLAYD